MSEDMYDIGYACFFRLRFKLFLLLLNPNKTRNHVWTSCSLNDADLPKHVHFGLKKFSEFSVCSLRRKWA
jgi:hypothetical protein